MRLAELKAALDHLHVRSDAYALDGNEHDDALVLERLPDESWAVYYSEHGLHTCWRNFSTEEDAGDYMYELLSEDPALREHRMHAAGASAHA